jgi:hypothetical protein
VRQDAAELAQTLLRPMGSIFQMEALDRVYLETAGHPQLMRQLCSEIVSGSQGQARSITEQDVAEATQRYVLGRPSLLYQLWEFMTPIEQGILLHLAGPEATLDRTKLNPQAQVALDDLAQLGVVTLHGGRHRIAPLVLQAWLAQTFSPG